MQRFLVALFAAYVLAGCQTLGLTSELPANAHVTAYGWDCDYGYLRDDDECSVIIIPANAHLDAAGKILLCDDGYVPLNGRCTQAAVLAAPANSVAAMPSAAGAPSSIKPATTLPVARTGPYCAENGSCYGDISTITGAPKTTHVRGYYRKDGTYVRGHYRSRRR